jgi:hypothetical protein
MEKRLSDQEEGIACFKDFKGLLKVFESGIKIIFGQIML